MFQNVSDSFINFSYVSELWLAEFLACLKCEWDSQQWTKRLEQQLEDEKQHAEMLQRALKRNGINSVDDLTYSIQESVYRDLAGFDMGALRAPGAVSAALTVLERRATLLYKIYLRQGSNSDYKAVIKRVLEDERRHEAENLFDAHLYERDLLQAYSLIDRSVFSRIAKEFGGSVGMRGGVVLPGFWESLYSRQLGKNLS
jgi:hypothetical protein